MENVYKTLSMSYDDELDMDFNGRDSLSPRTIDELVAVLRGRDPADHQRPDDRNHVWRRRETSSTEPTADAANTTGVGSKRPPQSQHRPSDGPAGPAGDSIEQNQITDAGRNGPVLTTTMTTTTTTTTRGTGLPSSLKVPTLQKKDRVEFDVESRHDDGGDAGHGGSPPPCSEIHFQQDKDDEEVEVELKKDGRSPTFDDNASLAASDLSMDSKIRDVAISAAIDATTPNSGTLSPDTLNARTDAIILEAHMACSRTGSALSSAQDDEEDKRRRARIKQALTDARKAKSLGCGTASLDGSPTSTMDSESIRSPTAASHMRTTREVLEMATSVLKKPETQQKDGLKNETEKGASPRRRVDEAEGIDPSTPPLRHHRHVRRPSATNSLLCESPDQSPSTARLNSPFADERPVKKTISKSAVKPTVVKSVTIEAEEEEERKPSRTENAGGSYGTKFNLFTYFWGGNEESNDDGGRERNERFGPLACVAPKLNADSMDDNLDDDLPAMATSLVRVMSDPLPPPTYAETVTSMKSDPRMPMWIDNQYEVPTDILKDNAYYLGSSRSVIVHEIQRGDWTWCTAWSPCGYFLAVGTENHHLAVIDTRSSAVWRVRHDKRVNGPMKKDATNSIRTIAWGKQFIAIGGTGNAVSILAPSAPYPILHTIKATGFVGSMHWLPSSNTLVIGSRNGKAQIIKIWVRDGSGTQRNMQEITSMVIHTVDRKDSWVNAVKFSPGGSAFAIGDGSGLLGVYSYVDHVSTCEVSSTVNFKVDDAILDVEWSPDGEWLYAGGEDNVITVINTTVWEIVQRIQRDRWVQFISSSIGGSHIAAGGVSSEVSILEVDKGWSSAINVSLKGLVPLSATWHPAEQYLVLSGQSNSILAVETTSARYVSGHFLKTISPVLAVEFSPDGCMAVIGNEAGVVTIFRLTGTCFSVCYELVLDCDGSLSIKWSANGSFVTVATGNKMVIIAHTKLTTLRSDAPPNASGFSILKVIRDLGKIHDVTISPSSRYVGVCGTSIRVLDSSQSFRVVREWECQGEVMANSWCEDGAWLATVSTEQDFTVYDMSSESVGKWKKVFSVETEGACLALAWCPVCVNGLQYCAFGGENKEVTIVEIRSKERTWEVVLNIPRAGVIYDLDWNTDGLVSVAVGDGTVTIMDLSYLQSGYAVNEMNYNWQRQALTCFTEIRRNRGKNSMRTVRWIPSAPGSDSLLAIGGTDGELEIVDLTEKHRCSGYNNVRPIM